MKRFLIIALLAGCEPAERPAETPVAQPPPPAPSWEPAEGRELLGTAAPDWSAERPWFNSEPLTLKSLAGKVVLVRFWTQGCSLCSTTAPALNLLHTRYADRGLVVVGFHHPKTQHARDPETVKAAAADLGFEFPVAIDDDWSVLESWWMREGTDRKFTSATFLVDRKGVLRWLHPGGEFHDGGGDPHADCRAAWASLQAEVERLVAER